MCQTGMCLTVGVCQSRCILVSVICLGCMYHVLVFIAVFYLVYGDVAQLARAPRSHRGGQGFESPHLHTPLH